MPAFPLKSRLLDGRFSLRLQYLCPPLVGFHVAAAEEIGLPKRPQRIVSRFGGVTLDMYKDVFMHSTQRETGRFGVATIRVALLAVIVTLTSLATAAGWIPAKAPLSTRWTQEVLPNRTLPEYPRPQMVRAEWMNLNGLWQFEALTADREPTPGKDLAGQILVPFPIESALSGVRTQTDRAQYRCLFQIPPQWIGRRILLHFGAVDWESAVYVNGKLVGTHRGGYDPFSFDVTDALRRDTNQELIVKVFDQTDRGDQPRGKQSRDPKEASYSSVTGIWQTVWIEPVEEVRIDDLVINPDVDASCLRLTVKGANADESASIQAEILLGDESIAKGFGGAGAEIRIDIPRDRLKLWSPASPHLYKLSVAMKRGDVAVDQVESYFGMRKIELVKDDKGIARIYLNGQPTFQIGAIDQGYWPDGLYAAPTDEALKYDIEIAKRLGFNMLRKSGKVEPARWYYWCDKLGMLVWQDMPGGDVKSRESRAQFAHELRRMTDTLKNSPSVVAWVLFNEGWGQHDTERYVKELKKSDPTRLVDAASGWTDKNVGDILDAHSYPGPVAVPASGRASALGAFGGLGLRMANHVWDDKSWGYRGMLDREDLAIRYRALLSRSWDLHRSRALSAVIYAQLVDVESECDGIITYDRETIKIDPNAAMAANSGKLTPPTIILAAADVQPSSWKFTTEEPGSQWYDSQFNDSSWELGMSGFGTESASGRIVRTPWTSSHIWLRRTLTLDKFDSEKISFWVYHDDDAEIYVNGVLAAKLEGYSASYEETPLTAEARKALRRGKNVIAVHCRNVTGGQYVDLGVIEAPGDD